MMNCSVIRIPAGAPHDMSGLSAAVEAGLFRPEEVVAVLGKTEGNGCVNDFTRGYAVMALKGFFAEAAKGGADDISYVMSGGTEGVLSPHFTVISRSGQKEPGVVTDGLKSLAIGVARTRSFRPEELGRLPQVDAVADAVARAVMDAGITSPGMCILYRSNVRCLPLSRSMRHTAVRVRSSQRILINRWAIPEELLHWVPG